MTASTSLKTVLASIAAVAVVGTAIAQGTPPTTSSADPATGAGQRSTQNTPMGSTGTPVGSGAGTATMNNSGTTNMGTSSMQGSNMGATDSTTVAQNTRPARADRN
ncbi:proteophosphoglycan ppg4 [Paracidovorax sp. MALMAid1276]|uniref:proteophosphoglycan ppg4 n=1 Tax=Paracidovorax sp. MALMAid1276 TaxID=3411631 RepID=UPI003B9AEC7C